MSQSDCLTKDNFRRRDRRDVCYGRARIGYLLAVLGVSGVGAGCSTDIFDVSVQLSPQQFPVDFGSQSGTVPAVACTVQNVSICGTNQTIQLGNGVGQADIAVGCDESVGSCYAQANAKLTYTVDVLNDEAFTSKVGRRGVSAVRMVDIAYTIPTNTTSFDIPRIALFVGPAGSTSETDGGVVLVDTIPTLAAGTVVVSSDARHLVVEDGSLAHSLMERNIQAKTPFVFIVTISPRLESGKPVPAGKLEVDIVPLLGLGLR